MVKPECTPKVNLFGHQHVERHGDVASQPDGNNHAPWGNHFQPGAQGLVAARSFKHDIEPAFVDCERCQTVRVLHQVDGLIRTHFQCTRKG